jgi:glycosyltransferase involved in cell wall biosynthesis
MNFKSKSVFYVNYSPYENAGYILDFFKNNFIFVYLFSIGFHDLGEKRSKNVLTVYKDGRILEEINYFHLKIPKKLEYMFVPIRSILNLCQIFLISKYIHNKYGKIDKYFSVNAFTAWIGLILRRFGHVKRTIFWVWDYYPLVHRNLLILLMRFIYWRFDRVAMFSDKVLFLNERLVSIYKKNNILKNNFKYSIVPIGTKVVYKSLMEKFNTLNLVFIGVLKKSQGLDFVLNSYREIIKKNKNVTLMVVGGGPDSEYFVKKAERIDKSILFLGMLDEVTLDEIIYKSDIGIATYVPSKSNVSYFGDPSKVKRYLGEGLPIITTDVFEFSDEIKTGKAGFVIKYGDKIELMYAIRKILLNYSFYSRNASKLAKKYKYTKIYNELLR